MQLVGATRTSPQIRLQALTYPLPVKMPNFRDPAEIAQDARAYNSAAIFLQLERVSLKSIIPPSTVVMSKLWHTVGGLYM